MDNGMEFEFEEKEKAEVRRPEMNEEEGRKENLIDTTDCLEAVGVFRGWKNFLFIVAICCLVLLQVSFWLVDTGYPLLPGRQRKFKKPLSR
jgi:hypothetical protein